MIIFFLKYKNFKQTTERHYFYKKKLKTFLKQKERKAQKKTAMETLLVQ